MKTYCIPFNYDLLQNLWLKNFVYFNDAKAMTFNIYVADAIEIQNPEECDATAAK